mgnify:CR=1 FL=1
MSNLKRKQPPIRRVPAATNAQSGAEGESYRVADGYDYEGDYEEGFDDYEETPPPIYARKAQARGGSQQYSRGRQPAAVARPPYAPPVPPRRDPFPYFIGIIMGMVVVGLLAVIYLLSTNNGAANSQPSGGLSSSGGASSNNPSDQPPAASNVEPDRISMADFKALYDDPAKRPLIVDVRAKDRYDAGHIKGSVSIPLSEVGSRLAEVPKDRLVVAYCQ